MGEKRKFNVKHEENYWCRGLTNETRVHSLKRSGDLFDEARVEGTRTQAKFTVI